MIYKQLQKALREKLPLLLAYKVPGRIGYPSTMTCTVVRINIMFVTIRYGIMDKSSLTTSTYTQAECVLPMTAIRTVSLLYPDRPRLDCYGTEIKEKS